METFQSSMTQSKLLVYLSILLYCSCEKSPKQDFSFDKLELPALEKEVSLLSFKEGIIKASIRSIHEQPINYGVDWQVVYMEHYHVVDSKDDFITHINDHPPSSILQIEGQIILLYYDVEHIVRQNRSQERRFFLEKLLAANIIEVDNKNPPKNTSNSVYRFEFCNGVLTSKSLSNVYPPDFEVLCPPASPRGQE